MGLRNLICMLGRGRWPMEHFTDRLGSDTNADDQEPESASANSVDDGATFRLDQPGDPRVQQETEHVYVVSPGRLTDKHLAIAKASESGTETSGRDYVSGYPKLQAPRLANPVFYETNVEPVSSTHFSIERPEGGQGFVLVEQPLESVKSGVPEREQPEPVSHAY